MRIVREIGIASSQARADYITIQDDLPDGWSLGGVLSYVGLGTISGIQKPKTPPPPTNPEAIKLAFDTLWVHIDAGIKHTSNHLM